MQRLGWELGGSRRGLPGGDRRNTGSVGSVNAPRFMEPRRKRSGKRPGSKQAGSGRRREPRMRPRTIYEPGFQPGSSNHPWWGRRWASRLGPRPRLTEEIAQGAVAKDRGSILDGKNSDQLDRGIGRILLLLPLLALTRGHGLAERTGMPSVKGLAHRGGERLLTGMVNQHGSPRHSLQCQPMSAHEVQTGKQEEESGEETLHRASLTSEPLDASEIQVDFQGDRGEGERSVARDETPPTSPPDSGSFLRADNGLPFGERPPARPAAKPVKRHAPRDGDPPP